jgi:NarL family two-component system response regulator LiaR
MKSKLLSRKQLQILSLISYGKNNDDISNEMNISKRTIEYHITQIIKKLDATNRTAAVAKAIREKIID